MRWWWWEGAPFLSPFARSTRLNGRPAISKSSGVQRVASAWHGNNREGGLKRIDLTTGACPPQRKEGRHGIMHRRDPTTGGAAGVIHDLPRSKMTALGRTRKGGGELDIFVVKLRIRVKEKGLV